jgi:hypothetical protein
MPNSNNSGFKQKNDKAIGMDQVQGTAVSIERWIAT